MKQALYFLFIILNSYFCVAYTASDISNVKKNHFTVVSNTYINVNDGYFFCQSISSDRKARNLNKCIEITQKQFILDLDPQLKASATKEFQDQPSFGVDTNFTPPPPTNLPPKIK